MKKKIIDFTNNQGAFNFKAMAKRRDKFLMEESMKFFEDENYAEKEFNALPPEQQIVKRCKLAWITEGDKRFITYVDKETNKAYRTYEDNYNNSGPQLPLIEITDFIFHEFVQSMMEAQAHGF